MSVKEDVLKNQKQHIPKSEYQAVGVYTKMPAMSRLKNPWVKQMVI